MVGAGGAQAGRHRLAALCLEGGVALAHAHAGAVDLDQRAGLGIDEREVARTRQLRLARVADLDGDDAVARRKGRQRPTPAVLAEVGDHDDETGPARDAAGADERARELVAGEALVRRDALGERPLDHDLRVAAAARRQQPPLRRAGA